jgi:hypothetical protein
MMATNSKSPYTPHPALAREAAFLRDMKQKTGKTAEEWMALIKKSAPATEKERRTWLKDKHSLGMNYAGFIAELAEHGGKPAPYTPDAYVESIFSGPNAAFRPLYEEILSFAFTLGKDVKVCPCETIVPFYRKHVFAQVKVPNRSRLDLGFALGDLKPTGKLIDTGGFAKKDRITHRIELAAPADFNAEAKKWMTRAYDLDA